MMLHHAVHRAAHHIMLNHKSFDFKSTNLPNLGADFTIIHQYSLLAIAHDYPGFTLYHKHTAKAQLPPLSHPISPMTIMIPQVKQPIRHY